MLSWLSKGVPLPWTDAGPPEPQIAPEYKLPPEQLAAWPSVREEYLTTGAIKRINAAEAHYVSPAFLVEKGRVDGVMHYRLVVDLRKVNRRLKRLGLRYEKLKDFGALLKKGDAMIGFDIRNAYHHLCVRPDLQKFLQFRIDGEFFQCMALPFGLATSPYYFTHLMLVVVRFLRAPGRACRAPPAFLHGPLAGHTALLDYYARYTEETPADILAYLDDFLAAMRDHKDLAAWVALCRPVFFLLGFELKERKCQWTPTCVRQHLGVVIDTERELFLVPETKVQRLREGAAALLTAPRVVARHLARFCGLAISVHLAFPPARFFLTSLYAVLRTKRSWSDRLRLSTQARLDLTAWRHLERWNGRALAPDSLPFRETMATDASMTGWGATWTPATSSPTVLARGFFNDLTAHINVRELEAVRRALQAFLPPRRAYRWTRVRLKVDNQVAMYAIRAMSSHSLQIMREVRLLFYELEARRVMLLPEYIPTFENIVPDALSRAANEEDYRLAYRLFRLIELRFGKRTVDRFASFGNRLCERFNSFYCDVGTEGIDAFAQDWTGERNWANPPWSLLPRLVSFLAARRTVEAVVLAPEWPHALWYPRLQALASDSLLLPPQREMFVPGHPNLPRRLPAPRWALRAFHLTPR